MNSKTLIVHNSYRLKTITITITPKSNPLLYLSPSQCHFKTSRIRPGPVLINQPLNRFFTHSNHAQNAAISSVGDCSSEDDEKELAGNESIWEQLVEIVKFSGPAAGLWLCGPLMSLMDTAVIGQSSSVELAAMGPGTVEIRKHIEIRGLAWPAILVGWVAQSASLGMKDSWGPMKALAVASVINGIGDVVLCLFLGYGIAGAAWATMVSQVVAGYMMIESLKVKGYNGYAIAVPSANELLLIFKLAAPVFIMMMSKVAFFSLIVYFATSMGTQSVAAHQVLLQIYCMFAVGGEPLSQTAQSFMPELIYGTKRSLSKARLLLKSLLTIGVSCGLVLGAAGTIVPWLFPKVFSPDPQVIREMHKVLIPYFIALSVTTSTHSLEGTLLAGRDLRFISISMCMIFIVGSLLLMTRFTVALLRLVSPKGILYSEDMTRYELGNVRTT